MENLKSVAHYLRHLGAFTEPVEKEKILEAAFKLAESRLSVFLFDGLSVTEMNYFFSAYLMASKKPHFMKLNTYDLVSICYGEHPTIKNVTYIEPECLLLWGGFNDPGEHKSYDEIVLDVLDRWMDKGRKLCIAYKKGRRRSLEKRLKEYPGAVVLDSAVKSVEGAVSGRKIF